MGGTLLFYMLCTVLTRGTLNETGFGFFGFLGFLLVGLGLWLITHDEKPDTKML